MTKDLSVVGDIWDPTRHDKGAHPDRPWRPLPLEVEEITPDWLTRALSPKAPGLEVHGVKVTGARHGFTSLIFVTMELNEAGKRAGIPQNIVVKGGFRSFARHYAHSYCMEAYGYRDVWANLPLNMPKIFFVDIELARDQSIIIMENLNDRGVKWGDGLRPVDYDMQRKRLSALAKLHVATWDVPASRYGGVISNRPRTMRLHMEESGYLQLDETGAGRSVGWEHRQPFFTPEGWATMWEVGRTQNAACSTEFRDLDWNRRAMSYAEKLANELPNCILHADTHLGNHYEEADGTPGFLDSQIMRDPPYFDVSYTITTGLDPYNRRKWERGLVAHWVEEMRRGGVELDFDDVMHHYALSLHLGLVTFTMNDTAWQTPAFNTAHVWRFCSAMMDNNTKERFDAAFSAGLG